MYTEGRGVLAIGTRKDVPSGGRASLIPADFARSGRRSPVRDKDPHEDLRRTRRL